MRRFRFSDTWRLYPAHCQVLVTLQHDLSIAAAADLLKVFGGTVPKLSTDKIKHIRAIQEPTAIMAATNVPTNSGCTNFKGGCNMSEGDNHYTTKGGYHF
jgi:hypothetical protein